MNLSQIFQLIIHLLGPFMLQLEKHQTTTHTSILSSTEGILQVRNFHEDQDFQKHYFSFIIISYSP